eukprot:TRINITY_DN61036_c0_g1_i2.p1 TRINITY_DN61036_c0_g1~~TRINITY_DN61036_c0_g1_i2.p1  ORF type:complete len:112 (-),score=16.19 TRINITY_DN61036_c0_g1_i2:173-508(-)
MIRRPPRSTLSSSSAASDVYKRQPVSPSHNVVQSLERKLECWEGRGPGFGLEKQRGIGDWVRVGVSFGGRRRCLVLALGRCCRTLAPLVQLGGSEAWGTPRIGPRLLQLVR